MQRWGCSEWYVLKQYGGFKGCDIPRQLMERSLLFDKGQGDRLHPGFPPCVESSEGFHVDPHASALFHLSSLPHAQASLKHASPIRLQNNLNRSTVERGIQFPPHSPRDLRHRSPGPI
ncbi:hypothetical protein MHYP_G00009860 [Metynnis hypsauchen]